MFRRDFFNSVTHHIDHMMGQLFVSKKLAPSELKSMDYPELRYWYNWVKIENDSNEKERQKLENAKGK
jgi:hypothetical protein